MSTGHCTGATKTWWQMGFQRRTFEHHVEGYCPPPPHAPSNFTARSSRLSFRSLCYLKLAVILIIQLGDAGTRIKCKGAKAIAEALAPRQNEDSAWTGNCTLEELHIDGAKHCDWIGDGGAIALADLLRPRQDDCGVYQPVLKSLSLQGASPPPLAPPGV